MNEKENKDDYSPNYIPLRDRLGSVLYSFMLIGFSYFSFIKGEMYIPLGRSIGRRRYFGYEPLHISLKDGSLLLGIACMVLASISLLTKIVDHYDKRNNEIIYRKVEKVSLVCAIWCFVIAVVVRALTFYKV